MIKASFDVLITSLYWLMKSDLCQHLSWFMKLKTVRFLVQLQSLKFPEMRIFNGPNMSLWDFIAVDYDFVKYFYLLQYFMVVNFMGIMWLSGV